MCNSRPQAAAKYPYDIKEQRKTACIIAAADHFSAKRRQHQNTDFKTLDAERNADNSDTQHQTPDEIKQCTYQPAKYQPDDIAYKVEWEHESIIREIPIIMSSIL